MYVQLIEISNESTTCSYTEYLINANKKTPFLLGKLSLLTSVTVASSCLSLVYPKI